VYYYFYYLKRSEEKFVDNDDDKLIWINNYINIICYNIMYL
jgi:hypothetical protein